MRHPRLARQLLAFLLAAPVPAAAYDQHLDCPANITRDTIHITRAPAGWTPSYLSDFQPALPLNGATLVAGAQSSMAISRPDWSGTIHGRQVNRWRALRTRQSGATWLACYYGEHGQNDAMLSRQIDARATECSVIYPKRAGGSIGITCK